jgi:CDP-diacylglycerol---glycerol-3-phosphate 3-phosphatidyltransferase
MNLPNKITLSRLALTVFFVIFLFMKGVPQKSMALLVFTIAAITDYLDGWIAKRDNITSDFGRIMDPLADKALTLSAFVAFAVMGVVPAKIVVIIILREVLVTGLRFKAFLNGEVLSAASAGKKKTISQMVSIFLILIFLIGREAGSEMIPFWTPEMEYFFKQGILVMMIFTAIFTVVSGVSYFIENRKYAFGRNE